MSLISRREQENLDIDWFCIINNKPVHIASMGGYIPVPFNERKYLRKIQKKVAALEYISEVNLNMEHVEREILDGYDFIDAIIGDDNLIVNIEELFASIPSFTYNMEWNLKTRLYSSTFVNKARKGFYSYARLWDTNMYELVAAPVKQLSSDYFKNMGLKKLDEFFIDEHGVLMELL